jgi:hypothetical protein
MQATILQAEILLSKLYLIFTSKARELAEKISVSLSTISASKFDRQVADEDKSHVLF